MTRRQDTEPTDRDEALRWVARCLDCEEYLPIDLRRWFHYRGAGVRLVAGEMGAYRLSIATLYETEQEYWSLWFLAEEMARRLRFDAVTVLLETPAAQHDPFVLDRCLDQIASGLAMVGELDLADQYIACLSTPEWQFNAYAKLLEERLWLNDEKAVRRWLGRILELPILTDEERRELESLPSTLELNGVKNQLGGQLPRIGSTPRGLRRRILGSNEVTSRYPDHAFYNVDEIVGLAATVGDSPWPYDAIQLLVDAAVHKIALKEDNDGRRLLQLAVGGLPLLESEDDRRVCEAVILSAYIEVGQVDGARRFADSIPDFEEDALRFLRSGESDIGESEVVVGVLARLFDVERLLDALVDLAHRSESPSTSERESLKGADWSVFGHDLVEHKGREAVEALYARIPRAEMRAHFALGVADYHASRIP